MPRAATNSSRDRAAVVRPPSRTRSKISNGTELLPGLLDGRSALARRYKDVAGQIITDQGGIDQCSESRLQLIRRFSAAACIAERMESRLVNGEDIDVAQHSLLCSTLVRIAQRIGINRRLRNVTPHLADYLDDHATKGSFPKIPGNDAEAAP
jgi:hypothetical protein